MAQGTITNTIGTVVMLDGTELENIQSIGELGGDAAEIDVTNLKDGEVSLLAGVKNFPSVDIVCFKEEEVDGNYSLARLLETTGAVIPVYITFPDATGIHFDARVKTKVNAVAVNGAVTFTVSLFKVGEYEDH